MGDLRGLLTKKWRYLKLNESLALFYFWLSLREDSVMAEAVQNQGAKESLKEALRVHIRWMIRRDMPEVLDIESKSFEFPWQEEDFMRCLRQRNCIGMVAEYNDRIVAEYNDRIVGFMVYELAKTRIRVLNFAVDPKARRREVGSQLVRKLVSKLSFQRRTKIVLEVRETNLPAQLFFRACEFRAISVLRNYYQDTPEDAYFMQYRSTKRDREGALYEM